MLINYELHRRAIEAHYGDRMTVFSQKRVADPITKASKLQSIKLYIDLPCHLDWGASDTNQTSTAANTRQAISVLLAPEPVIDAGSTITVHTEAGRDYTFKTSAPASVVPSHQEILLEAVGKA